MRSEARVAGLCVRGGGLNSWQRTMVSRGGELQTGSPLRSGAAKYVVARVAGSAQGGEPEPL